MVDNAISSDIRPFLKLRCQEKEIVELAIANKLKDSWEIFKPYWKDIQKVIPTGYRLCPVCGEVKQRRVRSHLASHGISPKQWYDELMGYKETPVCPCCKKVELKFNDKQLTYQQFCSNACNNRFEARSKYKKRRDIYGSNFHPELWTLNQIRNRGYTGYDDEEYIRIVKESRSNRMQLERIHVLEYGNDAKPYAWTIDQIKARGYSGENDQRFIQLIESDKKFIRLFRKRMTRKYGKEGKPLDWTDEQIRNRGYIGKEDARYIKVVIAFLEETIANMAKGGKESIRRNGSNYTPSIWTDEQIRNRGFSGRDDPKYIMLCDQYIMHCSKAGKENVRKYGFFGAPGSQTDEQIKNRGYTGRNDPEYLKIVEKKREQSRRNGKKTVKSFGCSLDGWGFKIDFVYDKRLFKLDSMAELIMILSLITSKGHNEKLVDSQHYYSNDTNEFNGIGAMADIRTQNIKTKQFTNWEVHDEHDSERIARKMFCTELNGDTFKLVPLKDIQKMKKLLLLRGVITEEVIDKIRYSNQSIRKPYVYDYEKEQICAGSLHNASSANSYC